jgi:hypothetical protein
MTLLPDNIDIDLGYEAFNFDHNIHDVAPRQNLVGTRLWA